MNNKNISSPTVYDGGRKIRNDIIFTAILLVIVSISGLVYYFNRSEGDSVIVTVNGDIFGEYMLYEDRTVEIKKIPAEDRFNILVIKDGQAYVENASCPDKVCVAHKPLTKDGESIVCLPNKVVIKVESTDNDNEPDIIS